MFMCIASVCSLGTLCVKHGCDKTLVLLTRYLQITAGKLIYMYTRKKCNVSILTYHELVMFL